MSTCARRQALGGYHDRFRSSIEAVDSPLIIMPAALKVLWDRWEA